LSAIKGEAHTLMLVYPVEKGFLDLPRDRWPRVIASLKPEFVTVGQDGVDVMIKPDFDGGWGYFVPKEGKTPPFPPGSCTYVDEGVYWYRPY